MASRNPSTVRRGPLSTIAFLFIELFIIACGMLASPQPTFTPVVVTVLVPPPTQTRSPAASAASAPTSAPTVILPTKTLAPPAPPDFPQVTRGGPNGDGQDFFRASLDFTASYFLRMYVFYSEDPNEAFNASNNGRGINSVEFTITSPNGDEQYYDRTERTAGYCFFGGGEPDCNPWTIEGGHYVWQAGGRPVQSGQYGLTITVTPRNSDNVGTWLWDDFDGNLIVINVP